MAMHKTVKRILKALSADNIEVNASRQLANIKTIDPLKVFHKTVDAKIFNGDYEIPVRVFLPRESDIETEIENTQILLFFHGGGWATESIDTYERSCARLAQETNCAVISVGYRLAPEYKFPIPLEDCYAAAKAIYQGEFLAEINPDKITLVGDSAGGNLAAAVSLMARNTGDFKPKKQILIYPVTYGDYTDFSPFESVNENGSDFILTKGKMRDYVELYLARDRDWLNPYFAPLREKDLSNQPDTLIFTAEFDPLRDEGEAYAQKLLDAGNQVELYRVEDAIHGFFALGLKSYPMPECYEIINSFLREEQ